ncbi:methyltransferase domain-containing protein [Stenotrophomonas sp. S48]|uniref:methyltransferase domain-containing protein n=1 Tax=unclassified Stenotrophomonas TaxID=196198 RepID=UPI001901D806|nr:MULTISPECIES: methyltransferase domain-containing protein [unclassified Stenotrophomonas]MBK0026106.1 methyltransferase domain-containing protein [Stenotrophomonas sp. S48]MBK0048023.1 methyltransferase domain-containing protein [Stenotrophomonas sp. S49]
MNHGTVVRDHRRTSWELHAQQAPPQAQPVDAETIAAARTGRWQVHLTPRALPLDWLGDVRGRRILCLASGGGQQAPVLAAAGADVTVFDLCEQQLALDRAVAARDGLRLQAVQGDMRDLQAFGHGSFDVVFHPVSNLFVPDVRPVWAECHRVLARDGLLLASFYNPVLFVGSDDPPLAEQGLMRPRFAIPYSDLEDLPADERQAKQARGEAMTFGHSLGDLIGGQLDAGFVIERFMEDWQPRPRVLIERYLPAFLATRARRIG